MRAGRPRSRTRPRCVTHLRTSVPLPIFVYAALRMATLDSQTEANLSAYAAAVEEALGEACVAVVLYGSAAGVDWIAGRSDLNTAIVVRRASADTLDALAPVVARWRGQGFALPVLLDEDQVAIACQLFPMELDDIQRQHRVLAGRDPFTHLGTDVAALRREVAQEAFGKLLRLRAFYLQHADAPETLGRLVVDSLTSFLTVLRHLLRLSGEPEPAGFEAALVAGERRLGPLPAMRAALAARGSAPAGADLDGLARAYVGEIERLVGAVQAACA